MTIGHLTSREQTKVIKATSATNDVRTLIANHLGVSVCRVTDDAHLTDDLGADGLDRLDLMIAVEDQFAGVEITDDDVDRIEPRSSDRSLGCRRPRPRLLGDRPRHITEDRQRVVGVLHRLPYAIGSLQDGRTAIPITYCCR